MKVNRASSRARAATLARAGPGLGAALHPLAGGHEQSYQGRMDQERTKAAREFRRMAKWIVGIGVAMAVGAIAYLAFTGELYLHMVIATLGGVFFSVVLGCGLMAAAFFSDKSGHDRDVTDATRKDHDDPA
jgi:hypothetical protein